MINPFDAGGYTLAEMTQAINILPNIYTRLGEMGLFRFEGITQRSVIIEQAEGVLNLLPTVPLGGPATVANRDTRSMRSFTVPWIPHDDVITPQDIQGVRGFGVADAADPLATVMERKLTRMRAKHAQTREYMEINALRGIVKDGAGVELYDYFDEFGLAQESVDFVLGTAGTQVQAKCREVLRDIETELKGETMTGVLALVSPGFFDKLIGHSKVEEAYKYFSATGAQPLREDTRRRFPFAGIVFEEYNATVTLSTGATETLIPANEGIAFPLGTSETFVTYGAPTHLIETANTVACRCMPGSLLGRTAARSTSRPRLPSCPSTSGRAWRSAYTPATKRNERICLRDRRDLPRRQCRRRRALARGRRGQWCHCPRCPCVAGSGGRLRRQPRRSAHHARRYAVASPAAGDTVEVGGAVFEIIGSPTRDSPRARLHLRNVSSCPDCRLLCYPEATSCGARASVC